MYGQRITRVQQNLISQQIDGLFITSPVNVFYLCGFLCSQYKITQPINDPEAFLLITQTDAYILTDARNAETAQNLNTAEFIPLPYPCDAKTLAKEIISQKLQKGSRIAFEESNISFSDLVQMKNFLKGYRTVDGSNLVAEQRLTKAPEELKFMTKAAEITSAGFEFALQTLKKGMTEKELAAEITCFFIKNADGVSFEPVVAFGKGSAIPHYKSSNKKIEGDGILLIDLGCTYKGYCGDMTRTVYIGKADKKFQEIYETVAKAQTAALESIKTKKTGIEIDKTARKVIENAGFGKNFAHGLGHGIGLEIHEDPYLKTYEKSLEDGMVFSVEPGIYIPDYGGVRIEDVVYLQEGKTANITIERKLEETRAGSPGSLTKTDKKLREL